MAAGKLQAVGGGGERDVGGEALAKALLERRRLAEDDEEGPVADPLGKQMHTPRRYPQPRRDARLRLEGLLRPGLAQRFVELEAPVGEPRRAAPGAPQVIVGHLGIVGVECVGVPLAIGQHSQRGGGGRVDPHRQKLCRRAG